MGMETITGCEHLSDDALLAGAKELAARERENTEALLRHLSEIGQRKLHEREGCASLFSFCLTELRLSEAESWRRSVAAEAARRYPAIYGMLGRGELNLAVVAAVAPHLNRENYRTLLRRCVGMSRRQVDAVLGDLQGRRETRDRVRHLAAAQVNAAPAASGARNAEELPLSDAPALAQLTRQEEPQPPAAPDARAEQTRGRRVEIKFTADEALWSKLERVRELLRFRVAGDRLEHLLDVLVELWLEKNDPERRLWKARHEARRAADESPRSRRVPIAVKAEVYRRDEGRCAYVSPSGTRCVETARLEFDHRVPFALGGRSDDASEIRLLCRAHNLRAAREAGLGCGSREEPEP